MNAGAAWCAAYPTSRSVDDLAEPFRTAVARFLAELVVRGCSVKIAATRRPAERAWLMRQAWDVDHELISVGAVPVHPAIDIRWTREGASEMVRTYQLLHRPSLTSRHIDGRAIDMSVGGWTGTPEELYQLGASFGVHKLRKDPPHWSDDGW